MSNTSKILWKNNEPHLLITKKADTKDKKNIWYVENGAWDLKLDEKTLVGKVLFTNREIHFDKITDAPKGGGYNDVLAKAKGEIYKGDE